MTESQTNTEIVKSIRTRYPKLWAYKIPDVPGPQQSPKPFDIIWVNNFSAIACETKLFKSYKSLCINDLRESQINGLTDFIHPPRRLSLVIAVYRFFDKERHRVAELFMVKFERLLLKKNISHEDLKKNYPCYHFKKGIWKL